MIESGFFPATTMPDADWWQALWPDPGSVLTLLGAAPGMTALDICCGNGHFTAPLGQITGEGGRVYGIDMEEEMLAAARSRVAGQGPGTYVWIKADARDLTTALPGKVDWALIANTFHGVPDKAGLAGSVAAILKPEGRFVIVNWHARPREETPVLGKPRGPASSMRLSPEATREVVEPAGFLQERIAELPPYHYGAVFRKS